MKYTDRTTIVVFVLSAQVASMRIKAQGALTGTPTAIVKVPGHNSAH